MERNGELVVRRNDPRDRINPQNKYCNRISILVIIDVYLKFEMLIYPYLLVPM
jgi:hypothetical protein